MSVNRCDSVGSRLLLSVALFFVVPSCENTGRNPIQDMRNLSVSRFGQMYFQEAGAESIEVSEASGRRFLDCLSHVIHVEGTPSVPPFVKILYQSAGDPIELSLYDWNNRLVLVKGSDSFLFENPDTDSVIRKWLLDLRKETTKQTHSKVP